MGSSFRHWQIALITLNLDSRSPTIVVSSLCVAHSSCALGRQPSHPYFTFL